jgi:hypothetical protein
MRLLLSLKNDEEIDRRNKKELRTCGNGFNVSFWEKTRLSGAQCFTIPPISVTLGWVGDDDEVFTES